MRPCCEKASVLRYCLAAATASFCCPVRVGPVDVGVGVVVPLGVAVALGVAVLLAVATALDTAVGVAVPPVD
jgi:hypothetical protein